MSATEAVSSFLASMPSFTLASSTDDLATAGLMSASASITTTSTSPLPTSFTSTDPLAITSSSASGPSGSLGLTAFAPTPSATHDSELSKESLSRLAQSLPKYLIAGGVVLGVFLLLALVSFWWKRRKRRARFGFGDGDEEWDTVGSGNGGSRRVSESSEKTAGTSLRKGSEVELISPPRAGLKLRVRVEEATERGAKLGGVDGREGEGGRQEGGKGRIEREGSADSAGSGESLIGEKVDERWDDVYVPSLPSSPGVSTGPR